MEFSYSDTRTPDGWREWSLINADVTKEGVVVATEPGLDSEPIDVAVDVVDIDVDDCRSLYVLDSTGSVHRFDKESDSLAQPPVLEGVENDLPDPCALCVTEDTIYVVDSSDGYVRAFSRERCELRWKSETAFQNPIGISHDRMGVSILDEGTQRGDGRLVRLDRGGTEEAVISGLTSPKDLTADRAGNRYVLDVTDDEEDGSESPVVRLYPAGEEEPERGDSSLATTIELPESPEAAICFEAIQIDEILLAFDRSGESGMTLCRLRVREESIEMIDRFEQGSMRLVMLRGRGTDGLEELYAIAQGEIQDDPECRIYRLEGYEKTRRNERTYEYDAQMIHRIDSGSRGTTWHRVTLDLDRQGRRQQVRLSYCATEDDLGRADSRDLQQIDDARDLTGLEWQRLSEPNPSDALLQAAEGRYLWVKIELIGNESSSPRVGAFRAYFPRQSYLRYLPAIYQEEDASEAFLERFLSIFESLFTDLEEEIEGITRYMDPEGIPADHLMWLGDWMALDMDEDWPEPARRELLARAPDLYRRRGTRDGLLAVLRIYLRHTRPQSTWRDALKIDAETIVDIVHKRSTSNSAARQRLGAHEHLRALSGEPGLSHMVAAWSRVGALYDSIADEQNELLDLIAEQNELLDLIIEAGLMTEDEVKDTREPIKTLEREPSADVLLNSDEDSLPYIAEYAAVLDRYLTELEHLTEGIIDDPTKQELNATLEQYETVKQAFDADREKYEDLIRSAVAQDAPYLIEPQDLDCIDHEAVRKPYTDLVGHERAFVVLTRPSVEGKRMHTVRRIVAAQQPAHTDGTAVSLQPWIQLGTHSYLGVNSRLSKRELVLDRSDLAVDAVLDTRERFTPEADISDANGDSFIS